MCVCVRSISSVYLFILLAKGEMHKLHNHNNHLSFFCIYKIMRHCLVVLFLLHTMLCLDGVSSRPFLPDHDFAVNNQGTIQNPEPLRSTQTSKSNEGMKLVGEYEEMEKIGSRPPRCEDKCYGCEPCEAIQVPTTSGRVGVQYTNYEPEGWQCKCGPTFYAP